MLYVLHLFSSLPCFHSSFKDNKIYHISMYLCFCIIFILEEEMVYCPGIQCTNTDLHHLVILEHISHEIIQDKYIT